MKLIEIISVGVFALFCMWMMGCAMHYDRSQVGFWDQTISAEGYGLSGITQFGPWNVGWIKWQRNIEAPKVERVVERPLAQTIETPPPDPCDWAWVYCR